VNHGRNQELSKKKKDKITRLRESIAERVREQKNVCLYANGNDMETSKIDS